MANFFLYFRGEGLTVIAFKGCQESNNFAFREQKLSEILGIQLLFRNFERTWFLRELKPPAWNVAFVLQSLARLPYEPMKLLSDRHLTMEMCFSWPYPWPRGLVS